MAETTSDYFFVIEENIAQSQADIYSSGPGREVLQPLARLALLQESNDRYSNARLYDPDSLYPDNLYDRVRIELKKEDYTAPLRVGSEDLAGVLHAGRACSPLTDVAQSYRRHIFEQVRDSGRSLDEAHQTLTRLHEDIIVVRGVADQWFDKNGIRIKSPIERSHEGIGEQFAPRLSKLDKPSAARLLGQEQKEAYFKDIPRGAKACYVEQINLRKYKGGKINTRQPLERSGLEPQKIYGYTDPRTGEFKDLFQV